MDGERFGIAELAELGGVTRRTVRYYIQEGLLPAPLGVGRGKHYSGEHLERLLRLKSLQERGLTLEQIRRERVGPGRGERAELATGVAVPRSPWTRVELAPGLEIHVSGRYRLPSPGRLEELVEWCQRHFRQVGEGDGDGE
jgi:DNA-binding transcriptional MerR regulator